MIQLAVIMSLSIYLRSWPRSQIDCDVLRTDAIILYATLGKHCSDDLLTTLGLDSTGTHDGR